MSINRILLLVALICSATISFAQTAAEVDSTQSKIIFENVEEEASFPSGGEGWFKFLMKNLNPNVPVKNGAPVGRYTVIVQFIVDTNGDVSDVKPLTNHGYGMEAEVVRILTRSGRWTPAVQNKRPLRAYRKQPVIFNVQQDDFEVISKIPYTLFEDVDNEIRIKAGKVKNEDLKLVISRGTVTRGDDGQFIVKVKGLAGVTLKVFGKKGKKIAEASLEVRKQD